MYTCTTKYTCYTENFTCSSKATMASHRSMPLKISSNSNFFPTRCKPALPIHLSTVRLNGTRGGYNDPTLFFHDMAAAARRTHSITTSLWHASSLREHLSTRLSPGAKHTARRLSDSSLCASGQHQPAATLTTYVGAAYGTGSFTHVHYLCACASQLLEL